MRLRSRTYWDFSFLSQELNRNHKLSLILPSESNCELFLILSNQQVTCLYICYSLIQVQLIHLELMKMESLIMLWLQLLEVHWDLSISKMIIFKLLNDNTSGTSTFISKVLFPSCLMLISEVLFGLTILNLLSKFTLASPCSSGVLCLRVVLAS